jgi:hypothetical protein
VVRLAAAAALFGTGSVAARRVLEALAATHSLNAVSAQIVLGNYPPRSASRTCPERPAPGA